MDVTTQWFLRKDSFDAIFMFSFWLLVKNVFSMNVKCDDTFCLYILSLWASQHASSNQGIDLFVHLFYLNRIPTSSSLPFEWGFCHFQLKLNQDGEVERGRRVGIAGKRGRKGCEFLVVLWPQTTIYMYTPFYSPLYSLLSQYPVSPTLNPSSI